MSTHQTYAGSVRKLVLCLDIGTTFSGVSYVFLEPGQVPRIHNVTRFPGQEISAGDCKIPSILLYTPDGSVAYAGAEAAAPGIDMIVEDKGLTSVEWFKLHLRPARLDSGDFKTRDLPPLPRGKSVVSVFADFIAYLVSCAKRFIQESHANGNHLWASVEGNIEFVLSHPNGWEGAQQEKMRQATIVGGLIPNTDEGRKRVHFVTEGEASLHFCIQSGLTAESIEDGKSVMIVDVGGGTVDISSYGFVSKSPFVVEEVTAPDCILQGSTRVNFRASTYLKNLLKDSRYGNDDDIKLMLEYFDKATKRVFKGENESSYIRFGSLSCNDPEVMIRRGQLTLHGNVMLSFFQPALDAIMAAIRKQCQIASRPPSTVFLVGGFAANPWLYSSLKDGIGALDIALCRPDSHTDKAVASGAASFFLEHFVSARVTKITYGITYAPTYDIRNPEHVARHDKMFTSLDGRTHVSGGFSPILKRGTKVRENEEYSGSFSHVWRHRQELDHIKIDILCYRGHDGDVRWRDVNNELYERLCMVEADTSQVALVEQQGPNGGYYGLAFDVVLLCGLTELQAQIRRVEKGTERR
ncbi:uncharacterized protein BXZ73DRAFT_99115 [Epithele typhae]|uniref:uncharacterized protein n=1 Tax=Epithele typhae TaxID=378194 RepID=UPI00200846A5|nr:uncharacterized protein BXZ73DRAFT_99115 [Epithele typhae]KAH9940118.1 hypothetical protein BXZ73DRAFT_99115 [Epithele typhae]